MPFGSNCKEAIGCVLLYKQPLPLAARLTCHVVCRLPYMGHGKSGFVQRKGYEREAMELERGKDRENS